MGSILPILNFTLAVSGIRSILCNSLSIVIYPFLAIIDECSAFYTIKPLFHRRTRSDGLPYLGYSRGCAKKIRVGIHEILDRVLAGSTNHRVKTRTMRRQS